MARSCAGAFEDCGAAGAAAQARLRPAREADLQHARALCREYGVTLSLAAADLATPAEGQVLWVDPAPGLAGLARLPGSGPAWRAQAGCTLGALKAAGLPQFAPWPDDMTVAAWLAGPAGAASPPGACAPGVRAVSLMFGDGVQERLGPFGTADVEPLRSAAVQRLVPALFELCGGADAALCLAQPVWPARFRLDALRPADPAAVNLARLLAGHGGSLAWVESVDLVAEESGVPAGSAGPPTAEGAAAAAGQGAGTAADPTAPEAIALRLAVEYIDGHAKVLFDPLGLFPAMPAA